MVENNSYLLFIFINLFKVKLDSCSLTFQYILCILITSLKLNYVYLGVGLELKPSYDGVLFRINICYFELSRDFVQESERSRVTFLCIFSSRACLFKINGTH